MQPYTPHGDSNAGQLSMSSPKSGCNLIPLTGTVTFLFFIGRSRFALMQPYTPHGDSNAARLNTQIKRHSEMQPYTPHGDSN